MQLGEKQIREMTNSSELVQELFLAELRRLDKVLDSIITRNGETFAVYNSTGFLYLGSSIRVPVHHNNLLLVIVWL